MTLLEYPFYPMLARTGKLAQLATAVADGYAIEPKIDGVRCLARVSQDGVRLFSRPLADITAKFPDVCAELRERVDLDGMLYTSVLLDGEIFVAGADGLPGFQLVQHRFSRSKLPGITQAAQDYPAHYTAFDILQGTGPGSGKFNYTKHPYRTRRSFLMDTAPGLAVPQYTQDEADTIVRAQLGEGLMLKRQDAPYEPGARSADWLKIKFVRTATVVVGGVTYGMGKRAPTFGGLLVGVHLPEDEHGTGRLTYTGTVGTGLTDARLDSLHTQLRRLRTNTCPFANFDPGWDVKFYVNPVVRVQVTFAEYTRDGIMRHPRFSKVAGATNEDAE